MLWLEQLIALPKCNRYDCRTLTADGYEDGHELGVTDGESDGVSDGV